MRPRLDVCLLAALVTFAALPSQADIVIAARDYDGKDWVWKNRFTNETMALDGNHKIISGYIWWNDFPASGTYKIQMEGVTFKSQGRTPYRFYIDNTQVKSGRIPCNNNDNCACATSSSGASWEHNQIVDFGTHTVNKGNQIKFWAESAYCGGLSSAGSYSSFTRIRFIPQGTVTPQAKKPVFSPNGGTHVNSVTVTISTATDGATIRYTTNGSSPTSSSTRYTDPITLTETTTLKARAYKSGMDPSDVASATFQVDIEKIDTVKVVSPNGGETFFVGDALTVDWKADLGIVYDVNIELSVDDGENWTLLNPGSSLQPTTDNGGSWSWNVTEDILDGAVSSVTCRVRVVEYQSGQYSDMSDKPFAIAAPPPVSATSPASYKWAILEDGVLQYLDRDYRFSAVPETLRGAWFLRAANDDKTVTDFPYVTFTSTAPLELYVAIESRTTSPYSWMNGFAKTSMTFTGSDSRTYELYHKAAAAGDIELGASEGSANAYTLVATEGETVAALHGATVHAATEPVFTVRRLASGVAVSAPGTCAYRLTVHDLSGRRLYSGHLRGRAEVRLRERPASETLIVEMEHGTMRSQAVLLPAR